MNNQTTTRRRILFVSTPVAPLGVGSQGGGVDTTLRYLIPTLVARGHKIATVAPAGSVIEPQIRICQITGVRLLSNASAHTDSPVHVDGDGIVERMWDRARAVQTEYDVIIAKSFDWLSFYLTPFFIPPVLHWITLCAHLDVVTRMIVARYNVCPAQFGFYSKAQAETFSGIDATTARIIPGAVDADLFRFRSAPAPTPYLVWSARISPEKGLEDAVQVANLVDMPLHVCGIIENEPYWQSVQRADTNGRIVYHGALPHDRLRDIIGNATAMLVTPKWVEAFGITVIEALACGTPVIAYDQGGPAEIIESESSGILVPKNDVGAMTRAVRTVGTISRQESRRRAENFTYEHMATRIEDWIEANMATQSD